ncbi:hypothetical protein B0H34DRAFT_728053 [Crassisporium funariophilum]|nr:hypothetical protein B0H34DRAFT_728053 [Crassisporium funariophilum]
MKDNQSPSKLFFYLHTKCYCALLHLAFLCPSTVTARRFNQPCCASVPLAGLIVCYIHRIYLESL